MTENQVNSDPQQGSDAISESDEIKDLQQAASLCFSAADKLIMAIITAEQEFVKRKRDLVKRFKRIRKRHEGIVPSEDGQEDDAIIVESKILATIYDQYDNKRKELSKANYNGYATFWE